MVFRIFNKNWKLKGLLLIRKIFNDLQKPAGTCLISISSFSLLKFVTTYVNRQASRKSVQIMGQVNRSAAIH